MDFLKARELGLKRKSNKDLLHVYYNLKCY